GRAPHQRQDAVRQRSGVLSDRAAYPRCLHADRRVRVGAPAAAGGCANGGAHLRTRGPPSCSVLVASVLKFIKANGLRRIRLPHPRQYPATHLLIANVHPKIVQEGLGHANIATTMDLYTHVMPRMQDEAASRADAASRAAISKRVVS